MREITEETTSDLTWKPISDFIACTQIQIEQKMKIMKTIYKSKEGKEKIINLYDSQLSRLKAPWKDVYLDTAYGRTHIIETGNLAGEPLLVFHGGNATTAYNLVTCDFIMNDFHIVAVDMLGHPGKSA